MASTVKTATQSMAAGVAGLASVTPTRTTFAGLWRTVRDGIFGSFQVLSKQVRRHPRARAQAAQCRPNRLSP